MPNPIDFTGKKIERMSWIDREFYDFEQDEKRGRKRNLTVMAIAAGVFVGYIIFVGWIMAIGIPSLVNTYYGL